MTLRPLATGVSVMSVVLQLKNYRKPPLQRAVVRIMIMCVAPCPDQSRAADSRVPLYAISSLIAIFSLEAAFFIDTVRDLYEVRLPVIPHPPTQPTPFPPRPPTPPRLSLCVLTIRHSSFTVSSNSSSPT